MTIYEFSGLPGAGKSTLCQDVINTLQKRGKTVISLPEVKTYKYGKNYELIRALICVKHFMFNTNIILHALTYKMIKESLSHAAGLILLNYKLQNACRLNQYDYCILEEGLIQYITSIPHNVPIHENLFLSRIFTEILNAYGQLNDIKCNISEFETIKRIRHRNNVTYSRFDSQDTPTLMELLSIKGQNLAYVRKAISQSTEIDMLSDYNDLINYLVDKIDNNPT